jgi:hypothetical protein
VEASKPGQSRVAASQVSQVVAVGLIVQPLQAVRSGLTPLAAGPSGLAGGRGPARAGWIPGTARPPGRSAQAYFLSPVSPP